MKSTPENQNPQSYRSELATVCHCVANKLARGFCRVRDTVMAEFREHLEEHRHLLDLALNEAEALAWETGFPQLVFPTLATEKARSVAVWHARQELIRNNAGQIEHAA